MTRERKIDVGLLVAGGALVLGSSYVSIKRQRSSTATSALAGAGYAFLVIGASRMSPAAGIGMGAAIVAVNVANNVLDARGKSMIPLPWVRLDFLRSGKLFDAGLDRETCDAAQAALKQEKDPAILHAFATKLRDANHPIAADAIEKRAIEITPSARVGQAPTVVAEAQARLTDLGYIVPRDGVLGTDTIKAIERFQSLHDLDIDGHLTAETLAALRASAAR